MTVNTTQLACMLRLAEGPANYVQLGRAAGITANGVRRACRHLLDARPVAVTYYHAGGGHWNTDTLMLTDEGRAAVAAGLEVVERRGWKAKR